MANLSETVQRPKGFPFSEKLFHKMKQERLKEIVAGKFYRHYDEWVLRGIPEEPFRPTVAIGIFPTSALTKDNYVYESEVLIIDKNHRPIEEYWTDFLTLPINERIQAYENLYFAAQKGREEEVFTEFISICLQNVLPSGIMLFNRPSESSEESAFMVSPRFVPPSATYRHLIDQAMLHKVRSTHK